MIDEEKNPEAFTRKWVKNIEASEKVWGAWRKRADKVVKRYEDDRGERDHVYKENRRVNMLWSNTETLRPALYQQTPMPEIGRRNKDRDPLGIAVSEVLERCLEYCNDSYDFDGIINRNVKDYALTALGVAWAKYDATIVEDVREIVIEGVDAFGMPTQEVQKEPFERVDEELSQVEYVHWKDWGCNPCRNWDEVRFVYRIHYFTREELKELTPDYKNIPLDDCPEDEEQENDSQKIYKRAKVFEIWDKDSGKVIYLSLTYKDKPVLVREPPVNLRGFFPCPRPLMGIQGKDIVPIPEYALYQDQAEEIDFLTNKIYGLTKALRVAGVYDGNIRQLGSILDEEQGNTLISVPNWADLANKGGLGGAIDFLPLGEVVAALQAAYQARDAAKADLYEATGLSDIVRGSSDPDETATAQAIKNQWGSLRIRDRQKEVQRFVRDCVRLQAEIIAEMFDVTTLREMSGVKLLDAKTKQLAASNPQMAMQMGVDPEMLGKPTWEEVDGLLKNDRLRSFSINIQTDSTIEPNEQQEKQDRTEFIQAVTGFLTQAIEGVQVMPELAPLMAEMLMFGVRGFKAGREMEGVIDDTMEKLTKRVQQPQPDPVQMADAKAKEAKAQTDVMNAQTNAKKAEYDHMDNQQKNQLEAAKLSQEAIDRQRDRDAQTLNNPGFMG